MRVDLEKIQEAKDKLGDLNADIIVELLNPDQYDPRRHVCCCMNPNHSDAHPSMSFNPKLNNFHCFSCGYTVDVLQAYMMSKNCTFIESCQFLFEKAEICYDFGEKGVMTMGRQYKYPKPKYSDNKEKVYEYWAKRKISQKTIDYLDIQQDLEGNTLFQYYDLNDVLVEVKCRLSRQFKKGQDRSKIWCLPGSDTTNILYNINRINTTQPLIITSGEGDCATCVECGFPNSVSINGGDQNTQWIAECWEWLSQFNDIILVHDNDESGRKFAKEVSTRLGEYRVRNVDIPAYHEKENGDKVSIKDLNELLYYCGIDAVRDAINEASEAEIPSVIDYSDVKKFDMSDVDGFITHFKELDDSLTKFYMGSTTIITGAPGSGKTSLLSTIVCQSVEQGYPAFVYSGELSNPSLKSWIDFCHAGRFGLNEYPKPSGGTFYKVNAEAFKKINEAYKGQIFFYKDSIEQTATKLLTTAESVVRKYGVKTLVFDNMTSVDLENTDENKWQKQESFIRDIINFSNRWNVCCIVVLHPKKVDCNRRMGLYDLSGVSASINLSHRVISLYRVQPKEKQGIQKKDGNGWLVKPVDYDVIIDVLKDRFGAGAGRDIGLFYDVPSKRFYDSTETLAFQYKWDEADHTYDDLPFGLSTPDRIRYEENREVFGFVPQSQ